MSATFIDQLVDARLDDALMQAMEGAPLILRIRRPPTRDRLIERATNGPMGYEIAWIKDGAPHEALLAAAAELGSRATTLGTLMRASEVAYTLFIVEAAAGAVDAWMLHAAAFAAARAQGGSSGPALVVLAGDGRVPSSCQALDDGSFIGPAEAAVFARNKRASRTMLAECGDAAAIEVARGDLDQLDRLLALPEAQRFDPSGWIDRQPASLLPGSLPWRGREEACPIWLARADRGRLQRRIWRGHVGVLFPWLAEAQEEFLTRHRARLPAEIEDRELGMPIPVEEFEWGHITRALRRRAPSLAEPAGLLRDLRNELAHGRPARWEQASRAEAQFQRLLSWN